MPSCPDSAVAEEAGRLALPADDLLRRATLADLDGLCRIESASQAHPWTPGQFADELGNPAACIDLYLCRQQPAAFLCSWLIAGELQIQNLATDPRFRRRGIAARLIAHVLQRSRRLGMQSAWLEVRAGNQSAIALYERFGFRTVGRRRAYYADGEDALLMGLEAGAGD
ncbi:MAG: ribosomal protein S18-alanine N-acetyltransferase [Desulfuromonadales bacterium]|nr:ribosomal protein S18-alanine N-acetyltransferase [Desulfuromonadales bacterium]